MQGHFIAVLCLALTTHSALGSEDGVDKRDEKLISTFQIVRFPNDVCIGSNSRNGTCYTSAECSDKDGTSSGSCADGFGVCCTFVVTTCGSSSSENLTYWTNPSTLTLGSTCSLTICPISDDICSIRLDLKTFVLTGPSTRTTLELSRRFGQVAGSVTSEYLGSTQATNCQADSFTVQGAATSTNPPMVCGTLSGHHMYVEADTDRCNRLTFSLGAKANTITYTNNVGLAALTTSSWDITASQIECTSLTLPPPGCTQYFWSTNAVSVIESANFLTAGTSTHLANQHDRFCVRRERGKCIGCFSAATGILFAISGAEDGGEKAAATTFTIPGGCCGYGTSMDSVLGANAVATFHFQGGGYGGIADETPIGYGYDCVIIPGAFGPTNSGGIEGTPAITQTTSLISQTLKISNDMPNAWPPQICGNLAGLGIGMTTVEEATFGEGHGLDETDSSDTMGDNIAKNISICTRTTPFILEFISDDIEGIGGESGFTEYEQITTGRGFQLTSTQIDC